MVLLVSHISGQRRTWCISDKSSTGKDLLQAVRQREGSATDVILQCEGRIIEPTTAINDEATVVATLRLLGGKGGFGSMLRAIGAQIEKTTNREACRDLSGRRLRDINEEKRLKDFIAKKADREREIQERKRQKFKMLQETPRHTFEDESYFQQRELREKNLYDSLDKAFGNGSKASSSKTGLSKEPVARIKNKKFIDDLDESSSDEEEEQNGDVATDDSNSSTSNSETTSHRKSCQNGQDETANHSTVSKKGSVTPSNKRSMVEESVTKTKKGRFMDDLDESSSEDGEEDGGDERSTEHCTISDCSSSTTSTNRTQLTAD